MVSRRQIRPVDKVVEKVKRSVLNGEGVNLTKIHRDSGYSESSALRHKARHTKTWDREMKSLANKLKERREDAVDALEAKDLEEERLRDVINMIDTLTENIRLIEGRSTENKEYRIVEGTVKEENNAKNVTDAEYEELEQLGDGNTG
jgi:hypothetical protein